MPVKKMHADSPQSKVNTREKNTKMLLRQRLKIRAFLLCRNVNYSHVMGMKKMFELNPQTQSKQEEEISEVWLVLSILYLV